MRSLVLKRAFDLITVILMMPLWLAVLLIIALLVWQQLGVPVLFYQKRPGCRARIFEMIKFRTMSNDRDVQGKPRTHPPFLSQSRPCSSRAPTPATRRTRIHRPTGGSA